MRLALLCLSLFAAHASAQITLRLNNGNPVQVNATDLTNLPHTTALLNDHGKQVRFEGVLMRDVLSKAGLDFSKELHGKALAGYVVAKASDGYQAVYAIAEFDPTVADSGIILADKREGQPLGPKERPYRIVVPGDKRPARSLRMLTEIDVIELGK